MTTFPLAMPAAGPGSMAFELKRVDFLSPAAGGRIQGVAAGVPLWLGRYTLGGALGARRSDEWRAFVDLLDGPSRYFLGRDYRRPFPLAYLDSQFAGLTRAGGGPFDGSATTWSQTLTSDKQPLLDLEGLPAGLVLSRGDYVGFRWTTGGEDRRHLVRLAEPAVADGSGVAAALAVRPAVHTVVPSTAVAHLDNPACLMKLVPNETNLGEIDRRGSLSGVVVGLQDLQP